jgi:hypothetical protein
MKIASGFFVYKTYITYKAHFSARTDVSKYNYKNFRVSYPSYIDTKGRHYYIWLAGRLKKKPLIVNFFITAFLINKDWWIGEIADEYEEILSETHKRLSRIENMTYTFRKDATFLFESGMKFNGTLGSFVLNAFLANKISLETFIIFRRIFNFNLDNDPNYIYI